MKNHSAMGRAVTTTAGDPAEPRPVLRGQVVQFVLIGCICAVVDASTYSLLLIGGAPSAAGKAAGFALGTTASYFINRRYTFRSSESSQRHSLRTIMLFVAVYLATLGVNVGLNELLLIALPQQSVVDSTLLQYAIAWTTSQGVSTILNFVLLRSIVFRR
ncbi:GtrA family protein [Pseudonocardia sp. EV170527-09]|uniref:GtrA family protein n=1 Tax=Pseudonocardia sp. EV170527-09 TaxID=2603411 RepID=UPI0011F39DF2|nr:GtrA family protein [Pseudonocardia sp. EV170527-09]